MPDPILPSVSPSISAAINSTVASPASATGVDKNSLAGNFQTFLTLLTTQLKNQNPLDPLDTNQFTQQLVQFAQVEQQLKQNEQLAALVAMERTAQATTALAYVGQTVVVDGQTAALKDGQASWSFVAPKPVAATITVKSASGQTVYSGNFTINTGTQNFTWDGRDNNGVKWPDGNYTLSVTARGRQRPVGRDLERGAGRGRFRRPYQEPAGAVDRRPDLHARQDQAGGAGLKRRTDVRGRTTHRRLRVSPSTFCTLFLCPSVVCPPGASQYRITLSGTFLYRRRLARRATAAEVNKSRISARVGSPSPAARRAADRGCVARRHARPQFPN